MLVIVKIELYLLNVIYCCFTRLLILQIRYKYLKKMISFIPDKDAVEKRLYVLQQQGYIYATDPT